MPDLRVMCLPQALPYAEAYARQVEEAAKLTGDSTRSATLILLEHAPVYTLGRATKPDHLLDGSGTRALAAEVVDADRGGSVTYHGPGQLTAYLLLNLKSWNMELHRHLWNLEEVAIRTLAAFKLKGERLEGMTGVWVEAIDDLRLTIDDLTAKVCAAASSSNRQSSIVNGQYAKVCAIGVGCRRWVTYHGLSLNVDLDLAPFAAIDPCGLGRKPVTSLAQLLGRPVAMHEAEDAVVKAFGSVLNAKIKSSPRRHEDTE